MAGILLLDDHPLLLDGMAVLLTSIGRKVAARCHTMEDALAFLQENEASLIIADMALGDSTGLDMLKTLRAQGNMIPFIIYSAYISGPDSRSAIEAGTNAIILKDSDTETFIRCLETVERGQNWIDRSVMNRAMQTDRGPKAWETLSPAEQKIAALAGQGLRNLEIAQQTGLAEGTVKVHLNRIFRKLGIASRMMLVSSYSGQEQARK